MALAAALCDAGLRVEGLAPAEPAALWPNTYGIWADELELLGLTGLLGRRWDDVLVYAGGREIALKRTYGLFDNARLQAHLLQLCQQGGMAWARGLAAAQSPAPPTKGSARKTRDRWRLSGSWTGLSRA